MSDTPPRTYAQWVDMLDRVESGHDACIPLLERGTLDWSAGVAERFVNRIDAVFTVRLKGVQTGLQRALKAARRPDDVARALSDARRALEPLMRLAALRALQPDVQEHLRSSLQKLVTNVQSSLEQSARAQGHAGEQFLRIVLTSPLCIATMRAATPPTPQQSEPDQPSNKSRRRILL